MRVLNSLLLFLIFFRISSAQNIHFTPKKISELNTVLDNHNSRAFIIYQNGKIINEKYFGKTISKRKDFDEYSPWYWASASKSLCAVLLGIAQQKGFLNVQDPVSKYLGQHWSAMPETQENKIKIIHLLSMDSGLDYISDKNCNAANCLKYKDEPGKVWFYNSDAYYLLHKILEKATNKSLDEFTQQELGNKIKMYGKWVNYKGANIYFSNAKSFLNFGKLILEKGKFEGKFIFNWDDYFTKMLQSSQNINPSYGYLWWLNGKSSITFPGLTQSFKQSLDPFAPKDLCAALGKNGQFLDVVPSENLIIVRFGEAPDANAVPIKFHREMWREIMK